MAMSCSAGTKIGATGPALPTYVARYDGGERVNLDTRELDIAETPLLYGLPFTPLLRPSLVPGRRCGRGAIFPDRPGPAGAGVGLARRGGGGELTVQPPHPEHGMGLDLWPARLYDHFASHPPVLGIGATVVFLLWTVLIICTACLLTLLRPRARRPPARRLHVPVLAPHAPALRRRRGANVGSGDPCGPHRGVVFSWGEARWDRPPPCATGQMGNT